MSVANHSYDQHPVVAVGRDASVCREGFEEVAADLLKGLRDHQTTIVLECYPGVLVKSLLAALLQVLPDVLLLESTEVYQGPNQLRQQFASTLGEDPVFGYMRPWSIDAYFDPAKLESARARLQSHAGVAIVVGTGASRIVPECDRLVYLSSTRWVLQSRQRAHQIGNLGLDNADAFPSDLYKNAFFLDWRVGDTLRHELFSTIDWFVDLDDQKVPRMLQGGELRRAVEEVAHRPFRVVPFFDPGPWGGQWMRERFGLPPDAPNYAWAFDCVPEENSVLLGYGDRRFSLPAQVIVAEEPRALLGDVVYREFGAEFPIRFDYLDTMDGGNLSLQVHPLRAYIREQFGMEYTQDESYYILDCKPGSHMFLGLREGVQPADFAKALQEANSGGAVLEAERWVNNIYTHRHDHFSIPAGTVHCSGKDNVVLEISATPYSVTIKLWDWGRLGLDGKPRPIHLKHGLANIQWDRDTQWVTDELRQHATVLNEGDGWREERTGLHALEFLETRRHWFTRTVAHDTQGNLHVLNLVEGDSVLVESPEGKFPAMEVHYGETFIVPAAVGRYTIRPSHHVQSPMATIQAYVRTDEG